MRVIFMGTPDFAVDTLKALAEAGHEICLVVTQPDRPVGRGKSIRFSPVKEAALELQIPVYQPERIKREECVEELRKYQADVIVVVAFGQILSKSILDLTPYGCINVHASLLPKYRGAAPIQWAILNGETETGVTTMQMDEGLDTGDMILKTVIPILPDETGDSLHEKLAASGAALCVETLEALEDGTALFEPQGEATTDYAKMLTKEMGKIDWSRPAVELERLIRGMNSWPGAYTKWNGKTMKLWRAEVLEENTDAAPGTVTRVEKDLFAVQSGEGQLLVKELQLPGKKRMETGDFLRGNHLQEGVALQ
jgi:methionyl-tRNA formyltransferase